MSPVKPTDEILRRNIWRSLLIMKSVALSELPGVVSGLGTRTARRLMRDLETHGYVSKTFRHRRQEYSQANDDPSLPSLCKHCGRDFATKACTPKETKKQKQTKTKTETETQAEIDLERLREEERLRKNRRVRDRGTLAADPPKTPGEDNHDAA